MSACIGAPGKLMLAGEYVVLEGAPALVAAVDRRAIACWEGRGNGSPSVARSSAQRPSLPPEALLTRSLAERQVGAVPHSLTLDVTALRSGDRKLGLGSSAAGAAAVAGAVFAHAGHDVSDPDVRRRVLDVALEGHRSVAPQGSGADVAASILGGFVRFRKDSDHRVEAEAASWPDGLVARVVWTGREARTSTLVAAVRDLEARDPGAYGRAMAPLREAAARMVAAFVAGEGAAVLEATRAHHRAMDALGRQAGAPIVEDRLARVAALAEGCGGAAKPSGAGGGDVAIALFPTEATAQTFDGSCRTDGMDLVDLGLGAEGVAPERRSTD